MTFLLNFVHFEAIFAYSETIFAYSETDFANFETKIPDRCGRGWGMSSFPCSKSFFYTCQTFFPLTFINRGGVSNYPHFLYFCIEIKFVFKLKR